MGAHDDDGNPLAEILASLRVSATRLSLCEFRAPWGLEVPPFASAFVYVMLEGKCLFTGEGIAPRWLQSGDVLLLTRPLKHATCSQDGVQLTPLAQIWEKRGYPIWAQDRRGDRIVHVALGEGAELTRMAGMPLQVAPGWGEVFMEGLPPVISIPSKTAHIAVWLQAFVATLNEERPSAGYVPSILRLAEIIFISAIAVHLDEEREVQGWRRALLDPALSRAIGAIQRDPARRWTVEELAGVAHMSRSTFALRFSTVAGVSPYVFLMELRLRLAADLLLTTNRSSKEIGRSLGYTSPSVFGAAFKAQFGMSPRRFQAQMALSRPRR